jgi:hypothetical protein
MNQEENEMSIIETDLKSHLNKIRKLAQSNTVKNKDGLTVITKDDPVREEPDWKSSIREYDK